MFVKYIHATKAEMDFSNGRPRYLFRIDQRPSFSNFYYWDPPKTKTSAHWGGWHFKDSRIEYPCYCSIYMFDKNTKYVNPAKDHYWTATNKTLLIRVLYKNLMGTALMTHFLQDSLINAINHK